MEPTFGRQNMQKKPTDKFIPIQWHRFLLAITIIFPTKVYLMLINIGNTMVTNGYFVCVAGKVTNDGL